MSKSILIVDDEIDVASLVGATLQDEGHCVLVAANGPEGLRRFQQARPDLLICDLMMPFMDGTVMCREIRSDPANANVPILVMSVVEEEAVRMQLIGHDGFLRKPFRRAELLAKVAALLRHSPGHSP